MHFGDLSDQMKSKMQNEALRMQCKKCNVGKNDPLRIHYNKNRGALGCGFDPKKPPKRDWLAHR